MKYVDKNTLLVIGLFTTCIIVMAMPAWAQQTSVGDGNTISLAEAQRLALQRNNRIKRADASIDEAQTLISSAWSRLLPSVTANASIIRNSDEISLSVPDFSTFDSTNPQTSLPTDEIVIQEKWGTSWGVEARMPIFDPQNIPLIKNAYANKTVRRLTAEQEKEAVVFAVTAAYYQVFAMKEMLQVADQSVLLSQSLLDRSVQLHNAGKATGLDVLRAELTLSEAQKQLDDAIASLEMAKLSLAHLCGQKGNFDVLGPTPLQMRSTDVDTLTTRAVTNRVEVRAAEVTTEMARRRQKQVAARWMPTLQATYRWDWHSSEGFSGEHDSWMLMFGASWTLFSGGSRIADLKRQRVQTEIAAYDEAQVRLDIELEVQKAFLKAEEQKRALTQTARQEKLAARQHRLVEKQYGVGLATSLELTEATTQLRTKQISHILQKLRYDLALLELRKAAGYYHKISQS